MQLDLSFAEMAGFGAIVAVLVVLFFVVVLGLLAAHWVKSHAARFRKLGIERTDKGDVQFSGYLNSNVETRVSTNALSFSDRVFGPSNFPPREDEVPPEDIPSA